MAAPTSSPCGSPPSACCAIAPIRALPGGCNRGLESARNGELLISSLLNQDTQVQPGWLNALHAAAADQTAGAIGCKILYPDVRTIQHAGADAGVAAWFLPTISAWASWIRGTDVLREAEFVTGAALAIRKRCWRKRSFSTEGFPAGYFEDADLCLRIRQAGWRILDAPTSRAAPSGIDQRARRRRADYYQCGRLRLLLKHLEPEGCG